MKLSDNTVLVTGGGSGIGLALAKAFVKNGSMVLVCGRKTDKLEAVHRENPTINTFHCDIATLRTIRISSALSNTLRKNIRT